MSKTLPVFCTRCGTKLSIEKAFNFDAYTGERLKWRFCPKCEPAPCDHDWQPAKWWKRLWIDKQCRKCGATYTDYGRCP